MAEGKENLPVVAGGEIRRGEFLVFGAPAIGDEEIAEVVAVLRSGWIGTGPRVGRFEEAFRAYTGAPYAMALNSCTAALHLSFLVAGLKPGDEVIVPTLTFAATANSVIHAGGRPILVDVDRSTQNVDPVAIERAVTPRTRAVIPVHFAGRPCEMDAILAIAARHGLTVIEDAAHATEAVYKGRKVGNIGDLTCFSFYVTKNLVTGEGGMVTTRRADWANRIKILGLHGMSRDAWKRYSDQGYRHYQVEEAGFKYNMMDIQAALGIHQLARIEANLRRREAVWARYDQAFADLPVFLPAAPEPETVHARHLYTLLLDIDRLRGSRDDVLNALIQERIGTGVHFIALHRHPLHRDRYGYQDGDFPNAAWISDRTLSLPLSARLSDGDVEDVVGAVRRVVHYFRRSLH